MLMVIWKAIPNTFDFAVKCFLTGAPVGPREGYAVLFEENGRWRVISEAAHDATPKADPDVVARVHANELKRRRMTELLGQLPAPSENDNDCIPGAEQRSEATLRGYAVVRRAKFRHVRAATSALGGVAETHDRRLMDTAAIVFAPNEREADVWGVPGARHRLVLRVTYGGCIAVRRFARVPREKNAT